MGWGGSPRDSTNTRLGNQRRGHVISHPRKKSVTSAFRFENSS